MSDIILWFIPVFVASLGAELFWAWKKQRDIYERKDTLACLAMGLGNVIIAAPLKFFWLWLFTLVYQYRLFILPVTAWWSWALLLVGDDFCYYWFHRCHHRVRLLWCTHVSHHSSQPPPIWPWPCASRGPRPSPSTGSGCRCRCSAFIRGRWCCRCRSA